MSTPELILASFLLTIPPGVPEPVPGEETWPTLRESIRTVAIDWEILDPRENSFILADRSEFPNDIDLLRRRYRELRDAPRLVEAQRLPSLAFVEQACRFNRRFQEHLERRAAFELDRSYVLGIVISENERLYQFWDTVRDVRCDYHFVVCRRFALKQIRDMLESEAYLSGNFPPPVPTWRFNEKR